MTRDNAVPWFPDDCIRDEFKTAESIRKIHKYKFITIPGKRYKTLGKPLLNFCDTIDYL